MRFHTIPAILLMSVTACGGMNEADTIGMPAPAAVRDLLDEWPAVAREAADMITAKYGQPDEATPTMLVWHDNGPWEHTIIYRNPVQHNFPKPHQDVLEQFVNYRVPPGKFDELANYDGSVIAERTKGVLSARCDKEGANFLALNLADEVITGKRTVEDARRKYGEEIQLMMKGQTSSYTSGLMFTPAASGTGDPDRAILPR
ncbi:MAG: hypothetical protein ACT443_05410 [Gemmatimonadota bacterium]